MHPLVCQPTLHPIQKVCCSHLALPLSPISLPSRLLPLSFDGSSPESIQTFSLALSAYLLLPSIHFLSLFLPVLLLFILAISFTHHRGDKEDEKEEACRGSLMHLPWRELDQDVWLFAMTFHDWCLVQSGDNRTHLAKSCIFHIDKWCWGDGWWDRKSVRGWDRWRTASDTLQ